MAKKTLPLALAESLPGPALYETFQLVLKASQVPQNFPAYHVPPGASVTLYPYSNGGVNLENIAIASDADQIRTSDVRILPPAKDVSFPMQVNNLGDIWAIGTATDGILAVVQAPQIG
jgi:hypothetical protein